MAIPQNDQPISVADATDVVTTDTNFAAAPQKLSDDPVDPTTLETVEAIESEPEDESEDEESEEEDEDEESEEEDDEDEEEDEDTDEDEED